MSRCRFTADLASARDARRVVEDALGRAKLGEETLFQVRLLTTELVTNAVRHARSAFELSVARRDGRIRVEVRDDSTTRPAPPVVDTPTRHRGLHLLEDLSDRWGVDVKDHDGKVVWFEVHAA